MRGLLPTIYMSANIAHSTRYALLHGPSVSLGVGRSFALWLATSKIVDVAHSVNCCVAHGPRSQGAWLGFRGKALWWAQNWAMSYRFVAMPKMFFSIHI